VGTCLRALALSEGTSLEPDAALLLASTYLLLGSPQGANGVLMERRSLLNQARYHDAAAFASAYARFSATVLADRREREARNLVSALSSLHPERQFGTHWCLLAAQAAEDIGLTQQAQEAYLQALSQVPPSALRNQVILKLAALYRTDERFQEASHLLTSLTPQEAGQFSQMAALRAAEISLDLGQPAETVSHCRRLMQQGTTPEVLRATLRVMGHAYEKLHNHEAAVYCFAGVVPDVAMDTHLNSDESIRTVPAYRNESPVRQLPVPTSDAAGGAP
jgi:tetratricopeptide (TPR) repeat protein